MHLNTVERAPRALRSRRAAAVKQAVAASITGATLVAGLASCSSTSVEEFKAMQAVAATCPTTGQLNVYVADDLSGSSDSKAVTTTRAKTITSIVTRVAACRGHLQVAGFTGSTSATQVVFDDYLGSSVTTTLNAWLHKAPALIKKTVPVILNGLADARETIPQNGSDITGQVTLAAQYFKQRGQGISPEAVFLTDGEQSVGVKLTGKSLTSASVVTLANTASARISTLPNTTTVVFAGIGKTGSTKPASTEYVSALTSFFTSLCEKTKAKSCSVVTDYTER